MFALLSCLLCVASFGIVHVTADGDVTLLEQTSPHSQALSASEPTTGVLFQSWISKTPANDSHRYFRSRTVYDSLVSSGPTVVSFGYIPQNQFPDWVYHAFDRRFSNHTRDAHCSVELLTLEKLSGRKVANESAGSVLTVPIPGGDGETMSFNCLHHVSQSFVRVPRAMGTRVPHNMPFWCLAPSSHGDEQLQGRVERTCDALRTEDLRLELFAKASEGTVPMTDITTHFTTTMGSYPLSSRPDLSKDIVIHAVMPYNRVDRFNKVVFHMWLSYHALMGFQVVSSITNLGFYDELPRHVANHPNISHFDSSILKAVNLDVPSQYHLPYVVEFEKMMLATWVRFEYRVLFGSRFVVNADPDEFLMAPHGPGFDKYGFSAFIEYNQSSYECNPSKAPASHKHKRIAAPQNELMVQKYLAATSIRSDSHASFAAVDDVTSAVSTSAAFNKEKHFVPLNLTDWTWTGADLQGIKQQAKFINWVVNEVFAFSVNPNSTRTNLNNFMGKGIEVVVHKQYVSTENTTTACLAKMLDQNRKDVYTFNKCFDYLSIMHPGTMAYSTVRSKYLNINQACVTDTIHYSCGGMRSKHGKISSSFACMCYRVQNQPYLFLMHFRENYKSGGHDMHQIKCSLADHEEKIVSDFNKWSVQKHRYEF